jgi:hypothetical protein
MLEAVTVMISESVRATAAQLEPARTHVKRRGTSSTRISLTETAVREAKSLRVRQSALNWLLAKENAS